MSAPPGDSSETSPLDAIPIPVLAGFRGVGQVFFQENALTGVLFALGLFVSSPLMAGGAIVGAALGTALAWGLQFNKEETVAGIYGFNSTLVGIATFFFFEPGAASIVLMVAGCLVATGLTRAMRQFVPFPTYTTPFIVTTWGVFFLGKALGAEAVEPGDWALVPNLQAGFVVEATMHGIGQVMFQGHVWTGLFFLLGIAVNDRIHAAWVLAAAFVGMLVSSYHIESATRTLDPERLIFRDQFDNIQLGLFGYNATLAAVALFLWRRSLIAPVLGVLLSVPLTELIPQLGIPALTAPFVLATWLVLAAGWLEERLFGEGDSPAS